MSWASSDGVRRSMLSNRRRDTLPELAVRQLLHARGLRYRVDYRALPSARWRVDIAFTRLVGGRQNTRLVEGVHGQVERVSAVVGETPVRGVLCFVNAEWPLFGGDFTVQGVDVVWPKLLQKRLRAAADADAVCDVGEVAAAVARVFRASVRRQAAE